MHKLLLFKGEELYLYINDTFYRVNLYLKRVIEAHKNVLQASMIFKGLKPLFDRVIVRQIDPQLQNKIGLLIPSTSKLIARVAEATDFSGKNVPFTVKPGDKVLLPEYGGVPITHKGEELLLFRESELLTLVEDTNI